MTLTLHLPPSLEEAVRRQAAAAGLDVEAFVIEAVRTRLEPAPPTLRPNPVPTEEELDALFDELSSMHPPVQGRVDDSRESIYD